MPTPAEWLAPLHDAPALQKQSGWRRVLALLQDRLTAGDDPAQQRTWARWLDALSAQRSPETRRRYARLLRAVAQVWQRAGLLEALPDLPVRAPRRRLSTVPLHRLTSPFSAYRRLTAHVAHGLTGQLPGPLIPPWLAAADLEALAALGLLLSGLALPRLSARLKSLQGDDIVCTSQGVWLHLTHAGHKGWFPLAPLPALLLLAWQERSNVAPQQPLFPNGFPRRAAQRLLDAFTQALDLPHVTPSTLVALVRLDLQQVLPQPVLAALLGLIPARSVPARQLEALQADDFHATAPGTENEGALPEAFAVEEETAVVTEPVPADPLLPADPRMGKALDLLRPLVHQALEAPHPPQEVLAKIRTLQGEIADHPVPLANLKRLLALLENLAQDRRLRPASRLTYWTAVVRVLLRFPDTPLEAIGLEHLQQAVEGLSASRVAVLRQAWKRMRAVLAAQGLSLAPLDLSKLRASRYAPQHPVLLQPHWEQLKARLERPLYWAAYFALRAGLRVSEVARLCPADLHLEGAFPYFIVRPSKGGKPRRVGLTHLAPRERTALARLRQRALAQGSPETPFFAGTTPRALSEAVSKALDAAEGLRFHDLRAAFARTTWRSTQNLPFTAHQLGHAWPETTTGAYLTGLDVLAAAHLQGWDNPLAHPDPWMPLPVLARLLGYTDRGVRARFREAESQPASDLPDGTRPRRPGRPVLYFRVREVVRGL